MQFLILCDDSRKVIFVATVMNRTINTFDYRGLPKGSWCTGSEPLSEIVLPLPWECSLLRSSLYVRSCHFLSWKLGVSTSSFRKRSRHSWAEYLKCLYILNQLHCLIWHMTAQQETHPVPPRMWWAPFALSLVLCIQGQNLFFSPCVCAQVSLLKGLNSGGSHPFQFSMITP